MAEAGTSWDTLTDVHVQTKPDTLFHQWPNIQLVSASSHPHRPGDKPNSRLRSDEVVPKNPGQKIYSADNDPNVTATSRPTWSDIQEMQVLQSHEEEEDEEEEEAPSQWAVRVAQIQTSLNQWYNKHKQCLKECLCVGLLLLYGVYFGYAMFYDYRRNIGLLVLTILVWLGATYSMLKGILGPRVARKFQEHSHTLHKVSKYASWVILGLVAVGVLIFIVVDVRHQPIRLLSGAGIFIFLLFSWIFSRDRFKIPVRVIVGGLILQLIFGLLILRWDKGLEAFDWFGRQFTEFLNYADYGSKFVFGKKYVDHEFVFQVMPGVVFFGACVVLLYYLGVLQACIEKLGFVMELIMGISPVEAFISAANVFLGANVAVLTIANFMPDMTRSELHCVMTTGFATVTGGLLGAYTSFGVEASHLISASVMSAPAALVMAKMLYPENQQSKINHVKTITFPEPEEQSAIHAYSVGASQSINIIANIVVNLIAFVAVMAMINGGIDWAGSLVGLQDLSLQLIFSYIFAPLVFIMGVSSSDCLEVGRLIGTKIFLSDIIAYSELGTLMNNRKAGLLPAIQPRSEVIATYALCGFGNFSDMGICLGAVGAIVPSRRGDLAQVTLRAMVAGNLACFITACMAGFLLNVE